VVILVTLAVPMAQGSLQSGLLEKRDAVDAQADEVLAVAHASEGCLGLSPGKPGTWGDAVMCNASDRLMPYDGRDCGSEIICTGGRAWMSPVAMVPGTHHDCVLFGSGAADCYGGYHEYGFAEDHGATNVRAIAGKSGTLICYLVETSDVECEVHDGVAVPGYSGHDAIAVATAADEFGGTMCALQSTGTVLCRFVQHPAYGPSGSLFTVPASAPIVALDGFEDHVCMLLQTGNVDCWGSDDRGEVASYVGGDAIAVSTGHGHTCVLTAGGDVTCWGWNAAGQAAGRAGGDAIELAVGAEHTCVRTVSGNVDCWGAPAYALDYAGGDARRVFAGGDTCILRPDGAAGLDYLDCAQGTDYPEAPRRGLDDLEALIGSQVDWIQAFDPHEPLLCWSPIPTSSHCIGLDEPVP
jgi:hypothetical protein